MQLHRLTIPLLVTWMLLLVLAGRFGGFGVSGWVLLGILGAVPLILAGQIHREPAVTMSESIRAARQ